MICSISSWKISNAKCLAVQQQQPLILKYSKPTCYIYKIHYSPVKVEGKYGFLSKNQFYFTHCHYSTIRILPIFYLCLLKAPEDCSTLINTTCKYEMKICISTLKCCFLFLHHITLVQIKMPHQAFSSSCTKILLRLLNVSLISHRMKVHYKKSENSCNIKHVFKKLRNLTMQQPAMEMLH